MEKLEFVDVGGLFLPNQSGIYGYVIIQDDEELNLVVNDKEFPYESIAERFFRPQGIGLIQILEKPLELGVRGCGHLDWDIQREYLLFRKCIGEHRRSGFVTPQKQTIKNLMIGVELRYGLSLD